jgi:hypothetical protein
MVVDVPKMQQQRVVVGGTFALDQTLERPLLLLLQKVNV